MNIKREMFYVYEFARILFNDYYNGHDEEFTKEELDDIKHLLEMVKKCVEKTKEEVNELEWKLEEV